MIFIAIILKPLNQLPEALIDCAKKAIEINPDFTNSNIEKGTNLYVKKILLLHNSNHIFEKIKILIYLFSFWLLNIFQYFIYYLIHFDLKVFIAQLNFCYKLKCLIWVLLGLSRL